MKILIFSEEYVKVTKGMFKVWTNFAVEVSKRHQVDIILNLEHWGLDETKENFCSNNQVSVHGLPFYMPHTIIRRILRISDAVGKQGPIKFGLQTLNFLFSPLIVFYMVVRLRQIRPDAVFSHNGGWPAGQLCRWMIVIAMLARVPERILIVHSFPGRKYSIFKLVLLPLSWMQAWVIDKTVTSVVTVSDSVKAELDRVFRHPVFRVHNGIDLSSDDLPGSSSLAWQPSGLTVGFVGALRPLKGPHFLLDAFKLVEAPCELAMLGPAEQDYLELLQQKAQLCVNKVSFLDFHPDVDSFMKKIDLLVVPSTSFESFGMVILEAMKHRKPVICTDHGGMKEVVDDGVTGIMVPAGNEPALAQAITKLLENPDMRSKMGEAGYHRLNKLFTSEVMAAQYERLLNKR